MRHLLLAFLLLLPATAHAAGPPYGLTPEENARFLAEYAAQPDVKSLPSGLKYRVKQAGKGPRPLATVDIVHVEYRGILINGTVFDLSAKYEPRVFRTGGVIPGWTQALLLMRTGDEWEVVIPANLGYGADGRPPNIPGNQTLMFTLKLVKVEYP